MKSRDLYDNHTARMYLSKSIVRVDGLPFYVSDADRKHMRGRFLPLRSNEEVDVYLEDDRHDFTSIPLGMMKVEAHARECRAAYIQRVPTRQWKIGLTKRNTSSCGTMEGITDHAFFGQPMVDCVLGNYMPVIDAVKYMADKIGSVPISRQFCMDYKRNLYFMFITEPVGRVTVTGQPEMKDKYAFLTELYMHQVMGEKRYG